MNVAFLAIWLSSLIASQPIIGQLGASGGQVAGRVIDGISQTTLAGATVILTPTMFPPGAAGPLQAVTNAKGEFVFERLVPGRYRLQAQKSGFAPLAGPFEERTIDVPAGQSITGLELALQPGALITGRIVDASGDPVVGVTVSALRRRAGPDGGVIATTAQMAQTNDRGEFQLASLPDGQYVVIAAPPPLPPFAPPSGSATTLAPTYYPGTPDKELAAVVPLAPAQAVTGLQFAMIALPAHQISGVVVDETGSPIAGAIVMLRIDPRSGGPPTPATGQTDENGAFRIGGIVAGAYQVMIGRSPQPVRAIPGGSSRGAVAGGVFVGGVIAPNLPPAGRTFQNPLEITVGDVDIAGLRILMSTAK